MRLAEVKFSRGLKPTPEQLESIGRSVVYGSSPAVEADGDISWWSTFLVDLDLFPPVPHEVVRYIGKQSLDVDVSNRIPMVNQKVNVMVPGLGLLMLTEVKVCTDYCTEALNGELELGWRIVAVCPQPDQRRPDYVLGRVKQDD